MSLQHVWTLGIAGLGVALFHLLLLPLPWLLGPMFACLIAALAGLNLKAPTQIGILMRTVLGVAVGATITPSILAELGAMVWSLALIPGLILACGLVGYPFFRRVCGFDPATSYYGAMPGGLQDMLIFGEEAGGSPRALSLLHATRVLVIVTALPFLLTSVMGADLSRPPGQAASTIPIHELALMVVIAIAGWRGAVAIGLFGATILGPMFLATAASLMDVIHHRPPAEAIMAAQFFIGLGIGATYAGVTGREVQSTVLAGLGYVLIIFGISAAFAYVAVQLGGMETLNAILAFAPGGQAEMTVLAIVAGADAALVVAHHLLRIVVVIIGAPIFSRLLR
ncbi:MAG: AbrB family transcriptional regulator [Pseudomonadota bacterium]